MFFHELAHAAHEKVNGCLKGGQDPIQEIVAELSAAALCRLVGKRMEECIGNSFKYIQIYADEIGLAPHIACLKVMSVTEKVLKVILGNQTEKNVEIEMRNQQFGGISS